MNINAQIKNLILRILGINGHTERVKVSVSNANHGSGQKGRF